MMRSRHTPNVLKGAFVRMADETAPPEVVAFQYNPEELHRKVEARGGDAAAMRTPRELITLTLTVDAAEALERQSESADAGADSIAPRLAALELLMHRPEPRERSWWEILVSGVDSGREPLLLFVWGAHRVVPVRLLRLDIAEVLHDPELRPLHAEVTVTMRVVTHDDLPSGHQGTRYWRRHAKTLEALAAEAISETPPVDI